MTGFAFASSTFSLETVDFSPGLAELFVGSLCFSDAGFKSDVEFLQLALGVPSGGSRFLDGLLDSSVSGGARQVEVLFEVLDDGSVQFLLKFFQLLAQGLDSVVL